MTSLIKRRFYKLAMAAAIVSLMGLLVVQIYWLSEAYSMAERQFDEKTSLALRDVVHQMLLLDHDSSSHIDAVKKVASNTYEILYPGQIVYERLDATIRSTLISHELLSPFELSVYEPLHGAIAFGNFYRQGAKSNAQATCLSREKDNYAYMTMAITFPEKKMDIVGGMSIWIFSGFTFFLILMLLSFVIIDLTKQKRIALMKADFVNNITHELQTPISNISIASEVISKSADKLTEDKLRHYANIIVSENQRLKMHVEQVLQSSMMERGELNLNKQEININAVVREVLDSFRLRVKNRAGQLRSNLDALQPLVLADPYHIRNVFFSLLDNAEKYSLTKLDISVTTENRDAGVVVTISDGGIGISKEYQPYIFDKFYRVTSGNVHDAKGFGLGLSYVQGIVSAHRGKVTVKSELDKGSSFEVYFHNC